MKITICRLISYELSKGEKDEIVERLWKNWEELNVEHQAYSHRVIVVEGMKRRKEGIEERMMEIEKLIEQFRGEVVFVDKRDFKFE